MVYLSLRLYAHMAKLGLSPPHHPMSPSQLQEPGCQSLTWNLVSQHLAHLTFPHLPLAKACHVMAGSRWRVWACQIPERGRAQITVIGASDLSTDHLLGQILALFMERWHFLLGSLLFTRAVTTEHHIAGDLNSRNLLSHIPAHQKSEIKVSAGPHSLQSHQETLPAPSNFWCTKWSLACGQITSTSAFIFTWLFSVCLCPEFLLFIRTFVTELGPPYSSLPIFGLDSICRGHISKQSHIHR
jgi:hypothetical protein